MVRQMKGDTWSEDLGRSLDVLTVQNEAVTVVTDGTNWWVTSQVATTIL